MFQNFLLRKMLRSQGVPEAQIETFIKIIEKNPDLFQKIAAEVKVKMDAGQDQQAASLEVMEKYKAELQKLA